ncbi:M23 family metallopeptidase, partial [Synechococcus sp. H55.10]|uniref:M23 family metallopeptidase n=2 Tax=unclassified Synechococcus TaxID=2626047 RepID=UPI0039C6A14E
MKPLVAAARLFFPQRRRLRFWLGLLWLYPTALLAQTQPNPLPPPPVVEPALDTPGAAALLLDGAIPLRGEALEAGTHPETVVGREMVIEPKKNRGLATPGNSGTASFSQPEGGVPVVLMERSSGRRIILTPGEEIRIEDPSQTQAPEPPTPELPELAAGEERLLYPLPHPVPITSGFGMRIHPIRGEPEFHAGVDLGASLGTPILASLSGKVVTSGSLGGLGITVVLEHAGNQRTRYGHMSESAVGVGEVVKQGTVIGYVGATGAVTGPHLHFELWHQTVGQGWVVLDATD